MKLVLLAAATASALVLAACDNKPADTAPTNTTSSTTSTTTTPEAPPPAPPVETAPVTPAAPAAPAAPEAPTTPISSTSPTTPAAPNAALPTTAAEVTVEQLMQRPTPEQLAEAQAQIATLNLTPEQKEMAVEATRAQTEQIAKANGFSDEDVKRVVDNAVSVMRDIYGL